MAVYVAVYYSFHLWMFSRRKIKYMKIRKEVRLKKFQNGTVNCGNCSAGDRLLKHCKECRESLCDGCVYCHENTKLTREHSLIQINEFEEYLAIRGQKRAVFCPVHPVNVVGQYCRSCEETTCRGCDGHQEHNAVNLAEGCSTEVPRLEEILARAIAKVGSHEKCASRCCSLVDELRHRKNELCSRINAYFIEYREKVREREDQLLEEVLQWYNMQFELIKNAQKKEERRIDMITDAVNFSQTLLKHGTDAEILSLKYFIHSHLNRVATQKSCTTFITAIEAAIRNASWDIWKEHARKKNPGGLTLPEVQNDLLFDEDDTALGFKSTVEGENERNASLEHWIKLKAIVLKRRGNSGVDGKDFQLGCVISRESSKIWGGFRNNERQIERDYRYDKILRNRSIGRQGSACGEFQHPCDITVDYKRDDRLIVTDFNNNRVQVFNYFGEFLFHFGNRGCGPGEFNGPTGIAVLHDGSIVVCDCLNNRVQLFTSRGVFIGSFGTEGRGQGQFWRPMGVAVDSEDRIVVVDQGNNRVQVFNSDGDFQFSFGKLGNRDGEISCPNFVAIDKDDNIYVSDEICTRIQIFRRDGSYLRKISAKEIHGLQGSVEYLSGIAVDSRGYVVAGVKSSCSVRVFTPDGRFLRSFSSTRPCPSRILFASGIALTSAGEIVVCDWFNNRVRFF